MSKIQEFVDYLETQVRNHSIYVLGGQGEELSKMTLGWLEKKEASTRIAEIEKLISECYSNGYKMNSARIFDCSGLGCYWFADTKHYINGDHTADMLYRICDKIDYKDMRTGDFVFQSDGNGKMHHIGYVCNIENNKYQIIEAKGRRYGVVKGAFNKSNWSHFARPKFWNYSIDRVLKVESPYLKGDDVLEIQRALTKKGYYTGELDGIYGPETSWAVQKFQEKETTVLKINYGKVNKNTAIALGFNWKE